MAEQKKKNKSADLANYTDKERENLLNLRLRMNPAQNGKAAKTRRTYQAETLGLPPLKMVLVHAQNDHANAAMKPVVKRRMKRTLTQQEAVIRIIEHLTKVQ